MDRKDKKTGGVSVKQTDNLRFADDIHLLQISHGSPQKQLNHLCKSGHQEGLRIDAENTKSMAVRSKVIEKAIELERCFLENAEHFKYLGSILTYGQQLGHI